MTGFSRNDTCWCGSGKKYKKCHLESDEARQPLLNKKKQDGFQIPHPQLIKSAKDIEGIRKSSQLTRKILTEITPLIKPGITTNKINDFVHDQTLAHGATPAPLNYRGFPKSCCTSINEVICHGIPSDRRLKEGDILNVDVTCILEGYYGDASNMYTVGEISSKAKKLIEDTQKALDIGIQQVKPLASSTDIGVAIAAFIEPKGYGIVREYGGHGIGKKFHEDPFIFHFKQKQKGMILLPNMVFTIEPMINIGTYKTKLLDDQWTVITQDNSLSAQWEHTVAVTETGVEILTGAL